LQAKLDGRPKERQIVRRHGHGERDRKIHLAAPFDGAQPGGAQVGSTQKLLAFELNAVELQIKLEVAAASGFGECASESILMRDADAVGVEQNVVNAWIGLQPLDQLKEPRMKRRLSTRELQDFDAAFAVNDALDALLQIFQRDRINLLTDTERRIRVTGGATQIARVDDFDEREAGGEFFERRIGTARGISSQRTGG